MAHTKDPIHLPSDPHGTRPGGGAAGQVWPRRGGGPPVTVCRLLRTLPGPGRRLQPRERRGMATWSRPGEGRLPAAGRGRRGAYSANQPGVPVAHRAAAAGGSDSGRGQGPVGGGGTQYLAGEGGDLLAVRMQGAQSSASPAAWTRLVG